ncbi:MAG: hypothetical protein DLM60_21810 [Pseudonocardiales bacterium]|nr:MAG: hypothetical protein DLM60_21810 [Pseudonocardiales bacterium]
MLALSPLSGGSVPVAQASQLGPAATSADLEGPWFHQDFTGSVDSRANIQLVYYTYTLSWHATSGVVDGFTVDSYDASSINLSKNATIDIQPFRALAWGPTYRIRVKVKADSTLGTDTKLIRSLSPNVEQHEQVILYANGRYEQTGV